MGKSCTNRESSGLLLKYGDRLTIKNDKPVVQFCSVEILAGIVLLFFEECLAGQTC